MTSKRLDIAVDFDGTVAHFDHWRGVGHTGAPIPAMIAKVKQWLAEGHQVTIYTARITCLGDYASEDPVVARETVRAWCLEHVGVELPITNIKGGFDLFYDDRAVTVQKNRGVTFHEHVIEMLDAAIQDAEQEGEAYAKATLRQLREYFQVLPTC